MGDCQRIFPTDASPLEKGLWKIVTTDAHPAHRLQAFRVYQTIADSKEAKQRLYAIWQTQQPPTDCALSENDYSNLSYTLAILLPDQADQITATQLSPASRPSERVSLHRTGCLASRGDEG